VRQTAAWRAGLTAGDRSVSKHDAEIHGAKWIRGKGLRALEFDGVLAYVDCGNGSQLKLKDKVTISARVYPKGDPSGEPVLAGAEPSHWAITLWKREVRFYVAGRDNALHAPVAYDQWNHMAGVFDGTAIYEPERIVEESVEVGADIVAVYATNQFGIAYYPSAIWPQHPNLEGRDYFGELVSRLQARAGPLR